MAHVRKTHFSPGSSEGMRRIGCECDRCVKERRELISHTSSFRRTTDKEAPEDEKTALLVQKLVRQHTKHIGALHRLSFADEEDLYGHLLVAAYEALPKIRYRQAMWSFLDTTLKRAAAKWIERDLARRPALLVGHLRELEGQKFRKTA
jgi:DNA-directed RNA polymerase specialized sigma24 family protein